jgi:Domain of unknown function (DUF4403)
MYLFRTAASFIVVMVIALSLTACAGVKPLTAQRPENESLRSEMKKEPSTLNITVEAAAKDLTATIDRLTPRELYKGATKTKGLSANVLRNGPIVVSAADNFIYLTIPVTMSMGYGIFETPAISPKLKFKVTAKVTPDWKLHAEVYYMGLSDLLTEDMGIGPLSIKPRTIVEGITNPLQRTLSDLLSKKLNDQFPLKNQVAKIWTASQKPILVDKNYSAWLKLTPEELLLYPLYAQNNLVKVSIGLKSVAELNVGPEPPLRTTVPLPNLKPATGADRSFRVALNTDLFYKDLLTIASPLLLNKEFGTDGKSVILKEFDLYGNGDHLVIKVAVVGSIEGTFYLTCRPLFNAQTNVFSVEDVEFDMQTQSLLLRSADWFLHGVIRSKIQEKLNMDLTDRLTQAKEMACKALAQVKLADSMVLTGTVKTMKLNDVMVQKDRITVQLYTEGETSIVYH